MSFIASQLKYRVTTLPSYPKILLPSRMVVASGMGLILSGHWSSLLLLMSQLVVALATLPRCISRPRLRDPATLHSDSFPLHWHLRLFIPRSLLSLRLLHECMKSGRARTISVYKCEPSISRLLLPKCRMALFLSLLRAFFGS